MPHRPTSPAKSFIRLTRRGLALAVLGASLLISDLAAAAPSCPATSPSTSWYAASLGDGTRKEGVVFDATVGGKLRLQNAGGLFRSTALGITDLTVFAAVADFDRDGWEDFVGSGESSGFLRIYENRTYENPEPDWSDPQAVRTPKFVTVAQLRAADGNHRWRPIAAADFNGDGWPDVFRAEALTGSAPTTANLWLHQGQLDANGNPTFQADYAAMASGTSPADLGTQGWAGTSVVVVDYNGDRKLDLLVGNGDNGGSIRVFLNRCNLANVANPPAAPAPLRCANNPTFAYSSTLMTNMGFGAIGSPDGKLAVFAYGDIDGDGRRDLVAGAPSCCGDSSKRLRMWPGLDGGGLATTPQSIGFQGGATVVLLDDFSGDGRPDLIVGTDNWKYNPNRGGESFYWTNDASSTPFDGTAQQLTSYNFPTMYDFDVGFSFDYDHDPLRTRDVMVADGNHSGTFFVMANRYVPQYVSCGTAASGVIPLAGLASSELVVTAARIRPTVSLAGGSARFYLSNDEPENWVEATPCPGSPTDLCAAFPRPVGRSVRWKVEMCSNASRTTTPTLSGMTASFDYTVAREHFRGGAVLNDGVVYLGGFHQPGDRGHLYAINAGLDRTYWDAATTIDAAADSERLIYTSTATGTDRLDFSAAAASSAALQTTMAVSGTTQASAVIAWVRSKRFGLGNAGSDKSRLGSIETSTPSVLTRPTTPSWYAYLPGLDRLVFRQFQIAHYDRPNLVLFGSKDGMIHAIRTNPTTMAANPSGREAWAFVPPRVTATMVADYTASLGADLPRVTAYPDGSPTLADFRRPNGSFATAAIIAGGNGSQEMVVLDVTKTIADDGTVLGPTPMWAAVPGDAEAGPGLAKPVVARVKINNAERYVVIAGTGIASDNPTAPFSKGRIVSAYDLVDGRLLWRFRAQCALTSDLVVFETDDALEPGGPKLDGFADRVVFADACGHVYKLDPGRDLAGGWNGNGGLGGLAIASADGVSQYALFSTAFTAGALGTSSPIAGTLALREDASGRAILFFGTGGLESHPSGSTNQFYAVRADDGSIRSKSTGVCTAGRCEKFYGGVVVTKEQVLFTRTVDPAIGTPACDVGSTVVQSFALEPAADGNFIVGFTQAVASAIMGGLFGDAGALYFATLDGTVSRIGTPRAPLAGGDSANPAAVPSYAEPADPSTSPFTLLGWRQVY